MSTFFDLVLMRSYRMGGPSGRRYIFYKGQPILVEDAEDIAKFRHHPDIFFECDENGNIVAPELPKEAKRSFRVFREENIIDSEKILAEAGLAAQEKLQKEGVNVSELLKAAEQDKLANTPAPVTKDESKEEIKQEVSKEEVKQEAAAKKQKKSPKNKLQCGSCGQIFTTEAALAEHAELHEDED